ncbi:MAG: hypothetical protein AAFN92_08060 [Bacteroidota bacterium]
MSSFRERLLTKVTELCQELFSRRLALVREQQLVSEKAKEDIQLLVFRLDALRQFDPFPGEDEVDESPLASLENSLENPDFDPEEGQKVVMEWVANVGAAAGAGEGTEDPATDVATSPLNQRMIDDLHQMRSAIDKSRIRLLRSGDHYDKDAYTAARNAFTLARSVYAERLRLGQVDCTNEEVAQVEQVLTPAIAQATGASFPGDIQTAADFMESRVFPAVK